MCTSGLANRLDESLAKSFLVSADQAHAVHPSWPEKHEQANRPRLHQGIVVKYNVNQRYATNALTASLIREVARQVNVPLQLKRLRAVYDLS
ncbi:unnamed protein product [Protopolystoma xenopodis]|uniref:aspartyl aminopeptidase n=1 Tax=Protopolystoma xenopodis TaxID=117903 RepID=A0A3S5CTZ8_9PLAT|nr:unnamed protein product [Protopolystoma xenopodis]